MIDVNRDNTALLITDPQNDFLSPDGATWSMVGKNVTENKTVENIEGLLKAAKENRIQVFISPHFYYPTDHGWKFEGTLEKVMHDINMFDRKGPLTLTAFQVPAQTGWNATSPTSTTAKPWWPAHTKWNLLTSKWVEVSEPAQLARCLQPICHRVTTID